MMRISRERRNRKGYLFIKAAQLHHCMGQEHETETTSLTLIPVGTVLTRWGNFVLCAHEVTNMWFVYLSPEISKLSVVHRK